MNETLTSSNSGITTKTDFQILEERIAKLEENVFKENVESISNENTIIIKNADRELYAKICVSCLSEDGVSVVYQENGETKARACFENETKPIAVRDCLESTYGLSIRTANCLTRNFKKLKAPKAEIEGFLRSLLENDGERLMHVRNLGKTGVKEVMEKCK